jgi:hypothetical protein
MGTESHQGTGVQVFKGWESAIKRNRGGCSYQDIRTLERLNSLSQVSWTISTHSENYF